MEYYNIEFYIWLNSLKILQPESEIRSGRKLLNSFRSLFPVYRIPQLTLEEYYSKSQQRENFCSWVTTRTKFLSGRLFSLRNKGFGLKDDRLTVNWVNRNNVYGRDLSIGGSLRDEILEPLHCFVYSKGDECCANMKSIFPIPVLLNILYLYFPDDFLPILSESWLDQITWKFSLSQRERLVLKAKEVFDFYNHIKNQYNLTPLGFVRFVDGYMGLSKWGDEGLGLFLEKRGFDKNSAEKCLRTLRMLSLISSGFCIKPKR